MSNLTNNNEFNIPNLEGQRPAFSHLRSEFIDIFAGIETNIIILGTKHGTDLANGMPLTQKISSLEKVTPPKISKKSKDKLQGACSKLREFVELRNSMVHGMMLIGTKNNKAAAIFQNCLDMAAQSPTAMILTAEEFHDQLDTLDAVAAKFKELL